MTSARIRRMRRRRFWRRLRRQLGGPKGAAFAVAGGLALAVLVHAAGHASPAPAATAPAPSRSSPAVAKAIAFAEAQLGKPYVFGGPTAPGTGYGFDCSGLVMEAFAAAGIKIPRTSQDQWTWGPQVAKPKRGDLVFFAGADGTVSAPGHVGLVLNPAKHRMIDAYETGMPVEYDTYGLPTSRGGLDPVGFTDPIVGTHLR